MALDGAYLHAVRQELLPLLDSRIEKIHQPTREELLVAFRGRTGGAKVLFSCADGEPYFLRRFASLHIASPERGGEPPLGGGGILSPPQQPTDFTRSYTSFFLY